MKNHGDQTYSNINKARKTREAKNNGKWHSIDYVYKCQATSLKRHNYKCALANDGLRNTFDIKTIRQKALQTLRKNFTFNKSKAEDKAYELLTNKFGVDNIIRQYSSNEYPFQCDFFIKSINTYVEFNGSWTHGKHAFNPQSIEDIQQLNKWIVKCKQNSFKKHNYYERAIYVWTKLDVKKRQIAKDNNINFVEVWNINQLKLQFNIEEELNSENAN